MRCGECLYPRSYANSGHGSQVQHLGLLHLRGSTALPGDSGKVQHSQITGYSDFVPSNFDQRNIPEFEHSTTGWISIMGPPTVHFIAGVADETWLYAIDDIADAGFDPVTGQFYVTVDFADSDGCTFYVCSYILLWEDPPAKPPTNNCPKPMTYPAATAPAPSSVQRYCSGRRDWRRIWADAWGPKGAYSASQCNSPATIRWRNRGRSWNPNRNPRRSWNPNPRRRRTKPTEAGDEVQAEAEGRIQTEAKAEGENHRLLEKETTWLAETWERRRSSAALRLRSRPSL